MRQPGFGVGGYCLTKDPLFAEYGARELLGYKDLEFPFSERAVEVNKVMPLVSLDKLEEFLGSLRGRRLLLLGVSYREGVADMREAPAETFIREAKRRGAEVVAQDPLLDGRELPEGQRVEGGLPSPGGFDAVVFAVGHAQYQELDLLEWLGSASPLIVDASRVLRDDQLEALAAKGLTVWSVGRGLGTR